MKNIILFTLFTLSISPFLDAQVVEKYIDRNNTSTTVIEKEPSSNDQEVLNTLSLSDYGVGQEVYIIDHRKLREAKEKAAAAALKKTRQQVDTPKDTATQVKAENPERNPIGEKVKRKRKRLPNWKSDRRGKRSSYACFKF
jgi:hypothetical protein